MIKSAGRSVPLGVVVDGGSSGEGEDIRDGSADELERVALISS